MFIANIAIDAKNKIELELSTNKSFTTKKLSKGFQSTLNSVEK